MSSWEQAMKVAHAKSFATRVKWMVLGHSTGKQGWCYHARPPMYLGIDERNTPPRERR